MSSALNRLFIAKYVLLINLLFFCISEAFAQQIFNNQQRIGVEDGLSQGFVAAITQDQDGFMWMGTMDGLCRYDGKGFKTFKYRAGDSISLASNTIYQLFPQPNNKLVIIYDGSFNSDEIDMRTLRIRRNPGIQNTNKKIDTFRDYYYSYSYNGKEIAGINGNKVGKFDLATGQATYASITQTDSINCTYVTPEGRFYLLSAHGVQVSDTRGKQFTYFLFPGYPTKISTKHGPAYSLDQPKMIVLPDNRLIVIEGDRLIIWDLTKQTSKMIVIPPPQKKKLAEGFRTLKTDSQGQVYFCHTARVFRLNQQDELKLVWEDRDNPNLNISSCYIDQSDVLWMGINAQGLLKIDLQAAPFKSYTYQTNFIGDVMEKAGVPKSVLPPHWTGIPMPYYIRQAQDSQANTYVCYDSYYLGYKSLFQVFKLTKQGFQKFTHLPKAAQNTAMLVMPNGEVRIYNQLEAKWYCWKTPDAVPYTIQVEWPNLPGLIVADARYVGGYTWISTYAHGLMKYDGSKLLSRFTGKQTQGILPNDLTEICPDPWDKNKFWLGSRGGGLVLWHAEKGLQRVFTTDDGLPNNTIYCLLSDKNGKLWCSTNKGIFRFDPKTQQVEKIFEKGDGLPGNEFNRAHKFMLPNGEFAFGGMEGYTIFNPADFDKKNPKNKVQLHLTALYINNQLQDEHNADRLVEEPLNTLSQIALPYNRSSLRLEFAALLFNNPQKLKYRYQLKGIDEDWVANGTNNTVSYATLNPGTYVLRLNATDNNGEWSDTVKEITIIIHPPLWATWWAYLLYALVIGVAVWRFLIYREERIKAEQSLTFEKKEAKRLGELDHLKNSFFANISHEFRTPLTLILAPLQDLLKEAPTNDRYQLMNRNAKRLFELVNQLLDITKLEAGQMKPVYAEQELVVFFRTLTSSFSSLAESRHIAFTCTQNRNEVLGTIDIDKTEKIITNLLSNAFKFTETGKKISVSIHYADNNESFSIRVKDEGIGISAAQLPHIFDRFYQVDSKSNRAYEGTGIGLALVKELVNVLDGTIEVESQQGIGTTFTVKIPSSLNESSDRPRGETLITEEDTLMPLSGRSNDSVKGINLTPPPGRVVRHGGDDSAGGLLLIVDDNADIRAYVRSVFETEYQIIEATDGLDGMERAIEQVPDLIISDLMMPNVDGLEFCRLLKSNEKTSHIPIVMLTAKANLESRIEGLTLGADDYLLKPFNAAEIKIRVKNLIEKQEKLRQYFGNQLADVKPVEAKVNPKEAAFLTKVQNIVEKRLSDGSFGVEQLAEELNMSPSQLLRKLKALTNLTAVEFVRERRLQRAAHLLKTQSVTIADVAFEVGFDNASYFSRIFQEKYGVLPSEYS